MPPPTDSSGVYSLPAGYLATTGETIQTTQHNPPFEDVATALTARLPRNGSAPMTAPLKLSSGLVGAPALTFAEATNTGLYKTDDGFGVVIAGALVAEFTANGMRKGALPIGLGPVPWSGTAAPTGWLLAAGGTHLRASYPDLWAFAEAEIALGNTLYTVGNGSTTFGIADMRSRVPVGQDDMGGSAAGRLSTVSGGVDALTLGAAGGASVITLTSSQIPAHTHPDTFSASHSLLYNYPNFTSVFKANGGDPINVYAGSATPSSVTGTIAISGSVSNNTGGGGSHANVQPSIVTNYIIFAGA